MRTLLLSTFLTSVLIAACSSTSATPPTALADASDEAGDAAACTGAPPLICDGCCGTKYDADECLNGQWACQPRGDGACIACDAGAEDSSSGDAAACAGAPPLMCDGCCGTKYAADECLNGQWACQPRGEGVCIACDAGPADSSANDASGDAGDAGATGDASACTGTAPNCFGNNASACCGNDPSGPAVCHGGAWMCGSAPAPGCNGMSCLHDAG